MRLVTLDQIGRAITRIAIVATALLLLAAAALTLMWQARAELSDVDLRTHTNVATVGNNVTATWLGVTTLLFDDGQTQILIDGFISRPSLTEVALQRPVESGAAMIDYVLNEYGMRRLAAIIPVHSHFDHAMDVGAIANRSSASILGSESTANIARGARVPEDQIVVDDGGGEYVFGDFTVTLVRALHAPVGWRGRIPLSGTIEAPLKAPVPTNAFLEGGSYSIVIEHPQGTTIVHGSGGYIDGALDTFEADVVMLGVGLLQGLGRGYMDKYWQAVVTATGAKRVYPIHFDDYTQPFGEVVLLPKFLDNFVTTAEWLKDIRSTWDTDTRIVLPSFGQPMILYPSTTSPEA